MERKRLDKIKDYSKDNSPINALYIFSWSDHQLLLFVISLFVMIKPVFLPSHMTKFDVQHKHCL